MILGPADADHYRVKVGRYSERWYTDPLPGCSIAPPIQPDAAWPSISTVKKASGNDWSFVAMKRIANAEQAELERLPKLDPAQRYDTYKSINAHGLNVAAGRGTILHWWGEDMLHGREPREVDQFVLAAHRLPKESLERAERYLPAFRQFFDTYQPELIATEYVTVHRTLNGVGYGGTPDGLWKIDGEVYAYDFKSRTEDGDHAAYPEEGAQIAAGVEAEYMIVEDVNGPARQRVPHVAAGMIVSLKPEGVRIYPVDTAKAFAHWEAMHAWWVARRAEREAIGRPWAPRKAAQPQNAMSRAEVVAVLGYGHDEGGPVDPVMFDDLAKIHATLPADTKTWFVGVIHEASRASVDFRAHYTKTLRRYELYRGLLLLAGNGDAVDDVVRALVALTLDSDAPLSPHVTTGHTVGAMSATQAALFAQHAVDYVDGRLSATVHLDGHLRLDTAA